MDKILITGGTGFVGQAILDEAVARGYSVRALSRYPEKHKVSSSENIEYVKGNIFDPFSLKDSMNGVTIVINSAGILFEKGRNTFDNVHVRGVENIISAAKEKGVQRIVHVSALGTRENPASAYHWTKWQGEQIIRGCGIDYTIFRPSLIFGKGDHQTKVLKKIVEYFPIIPVLSVKGKLQPVFVGDVAKCTVGAILRPETVGKIYELGGSQTYTFNEIINLIAKTMNKKRRLLSIPLWMAKLPVSLWEQLGFPFTTDHLAMLGEDNTCDISEVISTFSYQPKSFKDWLIFSGQW